MLSERIYQLRRKNGLSQEQLAERIGVSRQAISKWESGASTPELEKLVALSECFHISLDLLVRDKEADQDTGEVRREAEETKTSNPIERNVGIVLCLAGAVCMILWGVIMMLRPGAAEQMNAASTITLSGSGIFFILCVLSMAAGLVLLFRKK